MKFVVGIVLRLCASGKGSTCTVRVTHVFFVTNYGVCVYLPRVCNSLVLSYWNLSIITYLICVCTVQAWYKIILELILLKSKSNKLSVRRSVNFEKFKMNGHHFITFLNFGVSPGLQSTKMYFLYCHIVHDSASHVFCTHINL